MEKAWPSSKCRHEKCRSKNDFQPIVSEVGLVYDRNQGSVSGTETKVQFRYRSRNFFFQKNFLKNQIFVMFSHFLVWYRFYKVEKNLEIFSIWHYQFRGALMMEKICNCFFPLKSGFGIGYSIGPKVSPNFGFGISIRPKLKHWFRSLGEIKNTQPPT